jgi:hypothetical protein
MKFAGFIVGPERSGTTLTSALLSQHPEIYVINDPHYLNFFAEAIHPYLKENSSVEILNRMHSQKATHDFKNILDGTLKSVKSWYERWEEFKDDPVDLQFFYDSHDILCTTKTTTIRKYFHKFHLSLVPKEIRYSKPKYVVKIPDLARYTFIIESLYSDMPIIYNVRHPVCNIASIIDPNKDRGWSFERILMWYKCFFPNDILEKTRKNVIYTRYEDLIFYNRASALKSILLSLGLSTKDMLLQDEFLYPNKKVMRKTQGKVNPQRLVSSLSDLTPIQLLQALEQTVHIQKSFYPDLSLMKIIEDVSSLNGAC